MLGPMAVEFGPQTIAFVPKPFYLDFYFRECRSIGSSEISHLRRGDRELDREIHKRFG